MASRDPYTTEEQMESMIESKAFHTGCLPRNQCLFTFGIATGPRINEELKLRKRDVLDELGRIRKVIYFTDTKTGATIKVDFNNPMAIYFLKKWLKHLENDGYLRGEDYLFPSPYKRNQSISQRQVLKIYNAAAQEIGFDGYSGTHSPRKTWTINTWNYYHKRQIAGEQIEPLMKLFATGRWKNLDSMRRYLRSMQGDTSDSQAALYPRLQARYGALSSDNHQTRTIAL
jgi:integrase